MKFPFSYYRWELQPESEDQQQARKDQCFNILRYVLAIALLIALVMAIGTVISMYMNQEEVAGGEGPLETKHRNSSLSLDYESLEDPVVGVGLPESLTHRGPHGGGYRSGWRMDKRESPIQGRSTSGSGSSPASQQYYRTPTQSVQSSSRNPPPTGTYRQGGTPSPVYYTPKPVSPTVYQSPSVIYVPAPAPASVFLSSVPPPAPPAIQLVQVPNTPAPAPSQRFLSLWSATSSTGPRGKFCGFVCGDGKTCLSSQHHCDGRVQCPDGFDELGCDCKSRLSKNRHCDGVVDCPKGEDEDWGCGGCVEEEFSCTEGAGSNANAAFSRPECATKSQLCDGRRDCSTGKDEENCYRLQSTKRGTRGVLSKGLLQKMIRGKWYYICKKQETASMLKSVSTRVCESIVGDLQDSEAKVSYTYGSSEEYSGLDYAFMAESDSSFQISTSGCPSRELVQFECPPPPCGWPLSRYAGKSKGRMERSTAQDSSKVTLFANNATRSKRNRYFEDDYLMGKVVGGAEAEYGKWPFMCAMYRNGKFICGGSLVNAKWIVTAAHCTHGFENHVYEIQCGMTRRYSYSPTEQSRRVIGVYPHERYNKQVFSNDIAMLELEEEMHLSKYVTTACPSFSTSTDPENNEMCHVIGWGNLEEDGANPDHLQEAALPVQECNEAFTRSSVQICAGYEEGKVDACQGDSGGPFVCPDANGRYVLVGLVSFGRGCARPGKRGVYTRVSAYVNWMDSIMYGTNTHHKGTVPQTAEPPTKHCYRAGGHYIFEKFTCDRNVDCLNAEDEMGCEYPTAAPEAFLRDQAITPYPHITRGADESCGTEDFLCKSLGECIPPGQRCDGKRDCSDGSDEHVCSCSTVIERTQPQKLCDGFADCLNAEDEEDCHYTTKNEEVEGEVAKCPLSPNSTIPVSNWCDGHPHCEHGEDEIDCMMLWKTKDTPQAGFLTEKHSRNLTSGYLFIRRGTLEWGTACAEEFGSSVQDMVCPYLGLSETPGGKYRKRNTLGVYKERSLSDHTTAVASASEDAEEDETCTPIKVRCYEGSHCGERRFLQFSKNTDGIPDTAPGAHPWVGVAMRDGDKKSAVLIVHPKWAVAPTKQLDVNMDTLKTEYLVVKSGAYPATTIKSGPMEQIKRVNSFENDENGLTFLHLDKGLTSDFFTASLCTGDDGLHPSIAAMAHCVGVKLNDDGEIEYKSIKITSSCGGSLGEKICAEINGDCSVKNTLVFCTANSKLISDWYFAGYIPPLTSSNCWATTKKVNLVNPFVGSEAEKYKDLINGPVSQIAAPPHCEGFRCPYGTCLPASKVCDKINDCSNDQDEEKCSTQFQVLRADDGGSFAFIPSNSSGSCPEGYFRCETSYNCMPISAYCDGAYDCGSDDYTDEPEGSCDCKSYMKLVGSRKICDGVVDCQDRSDERGCSYVSKHQFQCDMNDDNSYIHPNLICDGVKDCRYGDDEEDCWTLSSTLHQLSEQKSGDTLSGYVLLRVKNKWHPYCSNEWSTSTAIAACNAIGYKDIKGAPKLYELDVVRGRQEEEAEKLARSNGQVPQDFSDNSVLILRKDEDIRGQYDYKDEDEESFQDCYVAFITCTN